MTDEPRPPPREEDPHKEKREWIMAGLIVGAVFLLLAVLTFQGDRAERLGFLAGIGWRPLQSALLTMLVFALFTLGLNLQFGFTGLINFGHVASLSIGAYTAAILAWGQGELFGRTIGFGDRIYEATFLEAIGYAAIIVVIACVVALLFALLLGIPTLKLREDYLAIVTIGAAEILRIFWLNSVELSRGPTGLSVRIPANDWVNDRESGWAAFIGNLREAPLNINLDHYYAYLILLTLLVFALFYVLLERLQRSPWGRVIKAIREDEDVPASLGKNVFVYKMQSLVLGSLVAAIAGVLYAWFFRFITPQSFLPIVTFYAWIILVVGGVANNKGTIVGSVLLWGIFETARNIPDLSAIGITDVAGPPQIVFIGVLLIVIMMFRPQGIMGKKEDLLFGK